uniref:NADH-ubiquinone oxidoreductase chain 4 n=1 Tax=Glycinde armigera TaxID=397552 RepID=A0A0U2WXY5_9ANNE|nr:NADH dehydrogenase subunit 4 [Glycinde armigera]
MLKIIIPSLSMLLMSSPKKNMWIMSSIMFMILTLMSISYIYSPMPMISFLSPLLAMDSLSAPLVSLTLWISAMMMIASQNINLNNNKNKMFIATVSSLNVVLMLTFTTHNMMFFYIMFELSLIPTLILIITWGYQPERLQAGMYLMLYTITASLPLLFSLLLLYNTSFSWFMFMPMKMNLYNMGPLWWLMTIMAFMVKMPMYLTHLWLPKAHVEAPVAGSMVLAGVLLKLGSYGLLRFAFLFSYMNFYLSAMFSSIAMWGAFMTSMICLRQSDMKSLIAYSSVGHMGILIAGSMSNTLWGWSGSLTLMIAHGLVSSALFAIANMTYETTHTRSIFLTKGLLALMPSMSLFWFLLSAMNMAAPPSINLLSEIMLLTSIMYISPWMITTMFLASFLAAAYSLFLYTSTQHGQPMNLLNPIFFSSHRNMSIIALHIFPVILMISSPQFISLWI